MISLAPDASAASAGKALASARKWTGTGRSDRAVWGLCQGSGKAPYQTRVDLSQPAFKCSCPSRKFPCKHGLGLLLLFAADVSAFPTSPEPGWVSEWIDGRTAKAEKKAERNGAEEKKPADPEAQAKRAAQREARVADGIAACRVWLEDVVRRGLAAAQSDPTSAWERQAARLVDAQAPGLAAMVREIPGMIASGEGWEIRTLDLLGKLHLVLTAGTRLDALPPDLATEARAAIGKPQTKEEALAGERVQDRWVCAGEIVEEEERLRVRRQWLMGRRTGRRALVLDFAAGGQPLTQSVLAGTEFDGELAFYPGAGALRSLVTGREGTRDIEGTFGEAGDRTIEAGLRRYAAALGACPWVRRWPLMLEGVRTSHERGTWWLVDTKGAGLPIAPAFAASERLWRLVSIAGGRAVSVAAEWNGEHAVPVSVMSEAGFFDLSPRWDA